MDPAERKCITILLHAVKKASIEPIDEERLAVILGGAGGSGSRLRAAFGDGSLQAIAGAAASLDIPLATVLAAYAAAKASAAAANSELDRLLEEQQRSMDADRAHGKTSVNEEGSDRDRLNFGLPTSGRTQRMDRSLEDDHRGPGRLARRNRCPEAGPGPEYAG